MPRTVVALGALFLAVTLASMFANSLSTTTVFAAQPSFQTNMYGDQEVPGVRTNVWGFVRWFFNDAKTEADYTVDVKGVSGNQVTGADVYRGKAGTNGPMIKHLADGGFIVTSGHMRFSAADLSEMASGNWYVSLKTAQNPNGEIRGQVALPDGFYTGTIAPPVAPPLANVAPPVLAQPAPVLPAATTPPPFDPSLDLSLDDIVAALASYFPDLANSLINGFAPAAPEALPTPFATCDSYANLSFLWKPVGGAVEQWLDLSGLNNNFVPGTYWGYGPLAPDERLVYWDGLQQRQPYYWRINALTPGGWITSQTGSFRPCS